MSLFYVHESFLSLSPSKRFNPAVILRWVQPVIKHRRSDMQADADTHTPVNCFPDYGALLCVIARESNHLFKVIGICIIMSIMNLCLTKSPIFRMTKH